MIEKLEELLVFKSFEEIIENHKEEELVFLKEFPSANEIDFVLKRLNIINRNIINPFSKVEVPKTIFYELKRYREYLEIIRDNKKEVETPKLKWSGSASQLGFIFKELAEKGYIDIPKYKGKSSNGKYAELLLQLIDCSTTKENLERELGSASSRSHKTEVKFKIPHISEL